MKGLYVDQNNEDAAEREERRGSVLNKGHLNSKHLLIVPDV